MRVQLMSALPPKADMRLTVFISTRARIRTRVTRKQENRWGRSGIWETGGPPMERDSSLIEEGTGVCFPYWLGFGPPFIPVCFPIGSWFDPSPAILMG
jgi:hypothetical protein